MFDQFYHKVVVVAVVAVVVVVAVAVVRSSHQDGFLKISVFIFQEQPFFSIFQEDLICSSNRHVFFQEGLSNRQVFSRRVYLFIEQILIYPRNPYLILEDIQIFQQPLFSHRTDINFPGSSISSSNRYLFPRKPYLVLEHIIIFQETPMPRT